MPDSKASTEVGLSDFDEELKALCEKHEVVTLDQLVKEVQEQGFLINNLFQLEDGSWRCSLLQLLKSQPISKGFYEYGDGSTPEDALLNAAYNADVMLNKSYQAARKKLRR